MKRITPRTCFWPLTGCLGAAFALSIGLTYRSNRYCYAGTCGEWLFPTQARLHVVVWYMWLSLSTVALGLRAFQPALRHAISTPLALRAPLLAKEVRVSGVLLPFWILGLYGILIGIWWVRLRDYFEERGQGLPGNTLVAAVALTGHLTDVTMGMVLLPVSRHSALASFFKLSPTTTLTFHMVQAYVLFGLVCVHAALYAGWTMFYNQSPTLFRHILPVLNPTYLYNEVWPGNTTSLGVWRASLIFTGSATGLIMVAMFLTSFPIVRRKHFNLFYFTHLLGIVAVVVICLHASTMLYCTLPGLSMWLLDWGMRAYELRAKLGSRLSSVGNGWYSLTMPLPRIRLSGCACHSPLAHFYIHHSESSIVEVHPFTTITHLASQKLSTSESDTIDIQFLFRHSGPPSKRRMQWTTKLASLVDEEHTEARKRVDTRPGRPATPSEVSSETKADVDTTLRLEGPYFTAANPGAHGTVVCLVAGTGLSGALAIAAAFKAQSASSTCNSDTAASGGSTCIGPAGGERRWKRCIVVWSVRESDYAEIPFFQELACPGLEFRVHKTGPSLARLDVHATLTELCGPEGHDAWCYISGPSGFISATEHGCGNFKSLSWFAARWD